MSIPPTPEETKQNKTKRPCHTPTLSEIPRCQPILALSFFIKLVFLCTPAPSVGGFRVISANCSCTLKSGMTGAGGGGNALSLPPPIALLPNPGEGLRDPGSETMRISSCGSSIFGVGGATLLRLGFLRPKNEPRRRTPPSSRSLRPSCKVGGFVTASLAGSPTCCCCCPFAAAESPMIPRVSSFQGE